MAKGFIAVSFDGAFVETLDGANWFGVRPAQFTNTVFYGIASTSTFALACGIDGNGNAVIARTVDGIVWTYPTIPVLFLTTLLGVACGTDYCVCIGATNTFGLVILTSTDEGQTWAQQTAPAATGFNFLLPVAVFIDAARAIFPVNNTSTGQSIILVSTNKGVSWVSHNAAGGTSDTLLGVSGNSSKYFAVGFGDPSGDTALIQTSADASTWAAQSPTFGLGYYFAGVWATDALTVVVGANDANTTGTINTSPNGVAWSSQTVPTSPFSVGFFFAVTKNETLWAAVGGDPFGFGAISTSPDGITWTNVEGGSVGTIRGIAPFDPVLPTPVGDKTVFVYDQSCHLFTTNDQGATWIESHQTTSTLNDLWPDLSMAVNDGDYKSMLSCDINGTELLPESPRVALSSDFGRTGTWSLINPDPTNNFDVDNFVVFFTGAFSTATDIIVIAVGDKFVAGIDVNSSPLYRSANGGATWTTVGPAREWISACCSANGTIMYATSFKNLIAKSTDGGLTWNDLAGSPQSQNG